MFCLLTDKILLRASFFLCCPFCINMTVSPGGLFSKTEMSEVLTEILRVDPNFDKDRFLKQCEVDIIPNILEAMISGDLDILKDWCYEAVSIFLRFGSSPCNSQKNVLLEHQVQSWMSSSEAPE
ncbi:hypothetical protein lerEdw1_013149 [Lerista edwardsae]|nr:hypothetical protein lerEdw1_013149 [Lerista edwardsae]